MPHRADPSRSTGFALEQAEPVARVTAGIAGYVPVLSSLAPVLATHAERIARPWGRRLSDVFPTGGVR
jgi:hypothetical protein